MKTAVVNGTEISPEAVAFELERLVRFYHAHGMAEDEIRGQLSVLRDKALEQAIGAKLLLDRAAGLDLKVANSNDVVAKANKLVEQALAHVADPTESDVEEFYEAHKAKYGARTLVEAHDEIKDLLRHRLRGMAMDNFIADLRASATIEYVEK